MIGVCRSMRVFRMWRSISLHLSAFSPLPFQCPSLQSSFPFHLPLGHLDSALSIISTKMVPSLGPGTLPPHDSLSFLHDPNMHSTSSFALPSHHIDILMTHDHISSSRFRSSHIYTRLVSALTCLSHPRVLYFPSTFRSALLTVRPVYL